MFVEFACIKLPVSICSVLVPSFDALIMCIVSASFIFYILVLGSQFASADRITHTVLHISRSNLCIKCSCEAFPHSIGFTVNLILGTYVEEVVSCLLCNKRNSL